MLQIRYVRPLHLITCFVRKPRAFWITLYVATAVWKGLSKRSNCFSPVASSAFASRVSRLAFGAWAARKLLSGAARRMQITGVAWNPRTLWTFALRADRACNPGNVQTSAVGMSSRGQSCMSLSSYGKCNGPDRVLPIMIQLPATDSAYKLRCSVLNVIEASTRMIKAPR